jgi:hypothetical protein
MKEAGDFWKPYMGYDDPIMHAGVKIDSMIF